MAKPRVLQIGMDPAVIDFSPWPGQDADKLRARIDDAEAALRNAGFVSCSARCRMMPTSPNRR